MINEIKQEIIRGGIELCDSGLIARTWGNVSRKVDDKHFAITASGREYHSLTEDEVIVLDMDDLSYEGDIKPSGEKKVHQAIYKTKPEAGFVIHTHQTYASAVSAMGIDEVPLLKEHPLIGDSIPCAGYGLPGTKKLTTNVASAVAGTESHAIIMANHGAVCYGKDYAEAFTAARELEDVCREVIERIDAESWHGHRLRAYLDDFAQMFGPYLDMTDYDAERLAAECGEDVEAVRMVVHKNVLAASTAEKTGGKPINGIECRMMHMIYKKKYSKLKSK